MADQTVRFQYPASRDYRRVPITGVIGGPTPTGLVIANLFFETSRLPAEQTGVVRPDGQVHISVESTSAQILDRELMIGLVMTPEIALSVGQWLTNAANAM